MQCSAIYCRQTWVICVGLIPKTPIQTMATAVTLFDDNNRYNVERHAYCLCLRVRPVTIFLALLNLVSSLICACYLLFQIINGFDSIYSNYSPSFLYRYGFSRFEGIFVWIFLLVTFVSSAMLLVGIQKLKPSYILPFFSIKFIYYLIRVCQYLVSIYTRVNQPDYPAKANEQIDNFEQDTNAENNSWSSNYEYTDSLLYMTMILILKTYFLCVIWKCYRYLQYMKEFILPLTLNNNCNRITNEGIVPVVIVPQRNLSLPPDYEEATKLPDNNYMPPDYQA